jgi:hypothetical protein
MSPRIWLLEPYQKRHSQHPRLLNVDIAGKNSCITKIRRLRPRVPCADHTAASKSRRTYSTDQYQEPFSLVQTIHLPDSRNLMPP